MDNKKLCLKLQSELTGMYKAIITPEIEKGNYNGVIELIGKQATTDAPDTMLELLSHETFGELIEAYIILTGEIPRQ